MTDELAPMLNELDAEIDAVRKDYEAQRSKLEGRLQQHFADGGEVTDRLLSEVDEFGREHALELMSERPSDYGTWLQTPGWRDVTAELNNDIDRLIDTHERLDDLTHKQEKLIQRADSRPLRIINIQGQAYEFDAERRELREVSSDKRHDVDLTETLTEPSESLTQQVAREEGIKPRTQSTSSRRDRTRER